MRQRVRQAIRDLATEPRPPQSKQLRLPAETHSELRRLRLDRWRIIYSIREADRTLAVLAVRQRPPYNYEDLQRLLELE